MLAIPRGKPAWQTATRGILPRSDRLKAMASSPSASAQTIECAVVVPGPIMVTDIHAGGGCTLDLFVVGGDCHVPRHRPTRLRHYDGGRGNSGQREFLLQFRGGCSCAVAPPRLQNVLARSGRLSRPHQHCHHRSNIRRLVPASLLPILLVVHVATPHTEHGPPIGCRLPSPALWSSDAKPRASVTGPGQ